MSGVIPIGFVASMDEGGQLAAPGARMGSAVQWGVVCGRHPPPGLPVPISIFPTTTNTTNSMMGKLRRIISCENGCPRYRISFFSLFFASLFSFFLMKCYINHHLYLLDGMMPATMAVILDPASPRELTSSSVYNTTLPSRVSPGSFNSGPGAWLRKYLMLPKCRTTGRAVALCPECGHGRPCSEPHRRRAGPG
jgi:hypothetical protein